jgi:hypothetical protein
MNKLYIALAVVFGIGILSITYLNLVVVPREAIEAKAVADQKERESEIYLLERKEQQYDDCIASSYKVYSKGWDAQCEYLGYEANCSLSPNEYSVIESRHEEDNSACVVRFK